MTMSHYNGCMVCLCDDCDDEECEIRLIQQRKHRTLREVFEAAHATYQLARLKPELERECLSQLIQYRHQIRSMRKESKGKFNV